MLLRSSSTPVLGSLLSSFSETPNRDFDRKISISHGGYSSFSSFSCSSSPITPSVGGGGGYSEFDKDSIRKKSSSLGGFRRAQSDGNLKGLAADMDEFNSSSKPLPRSLRKPHHSMLQSIPSFSVFNSSNEYDEEEEEEEEEEVVVVEEALKRSITIGDNITGVGSGEFCESQMELIKEEGVAGNELLSFSGNDEDGQPKSPPMYLAMGLGMDVGFGGGGGGGFRLPEFGEGWGDRSGMEEYYKTMVEDNPGNPLFLRNYANFLYQSKGDLQGAEEYYSRAILSDAGDGDTLSQYAKIIWELHRDHKRASSYFERAVEVAPQDSHVHAAYASFLWETEDDEEEEEIFQGIAGASVFESRVMTSASA